jgi:hypothetical protein
MNHLLITGLPRTGTTLMHRLLDGHPQLLCYPMEDGLWEAQHCWGVDLGSLWRAGFEPLWDFLDRRTGLSERYFQDYVRQREEAARDWKLFEASLKEPLDFSAFKRRLAEAVARNPNPTFGEVLWGVYTAFLPSFFSSSLALRAPSPLRGEGWGEGYLASRRVRNVKVYRAFFGRFPEGRILCMSRDPARSFASLRHVRRVASDEGRLLRAARWFSRVCKEEAALLREASRAFPDRVKTVRLEDLARDLEGQMREVAGFLGVDFDESLLRPTVAGRPWLGNSLQHSVIEGFSGEVASSGVDQDLSMKVRSVLTMGGFPRVLKKWFGFDVFRAGVSPQS